MSNSKPIGTPVRCPACRYPNLAIDIWCERCGRPLEWRQTQALPSAMTPLAPAVEAAPATAQRAYCPNCGAPDLHTAKYCPRCGSTMSRYPHDSLGPPSPHPRRRQRRRMLPRISFPALTLPRIAMPTRPMTWRSIPHVSVPRVSMPRVGLPRVPGIVLVVAGVLAVLLIVPLAYVLLPSSHAVGAGQHGGTNLSSTGKSSSGTSPQAAAIPGVEAKTGLRFAAKCPTNAACLSVVGQTLGQDAAAVIFSTASSGGRQCAAYVVHRGGSWHLLDAVCGLPDQLSPLVGHDATVHVPGSCANVRDAAGLTARVVGCIADGTAVRVDGGPTYADGRLWWHEKAGWLAHDFLVGP